MISVIVPIYNIDEYLPRCLDSIIAQTYKNLEIILVDDGSTDSSGMICNQYAEKDNRIKVIHKKNGGVSSARNVGLDVATGDYISFVDGDDLLTECLFEVLLRNAEEKRCDISCCQIRTVDIQGKYNRIYSLSNEFFSRDYIISNFFSDEFVKDLMYSVYGKIYKKSLINELRFKNYKYGEDILFSFQALEKTSGVFFDKYTGYYYIHRQNSAMSSKFSKKRLDYILAIKEIEEACRSKYQFAYDDAMLWVYRHVLITLRQVLANKMQHETEEFIKESKIYLKKNKVNLKKMSIVRKIDYLIVMYAPSFMPFVYSLLKKVKK